VSADEADRGRRVIEDWADRYGSGRLLRALEEDELPRRLYLEERAAYELPGFEIDFEESFQLSAVAAPDEVSAEALGAVVEELEASGIACQACDVVRRTTEREGRLAVRIKGWEEGLTAVGYIATAAGDVLIDSGFPFNTATRGAPPLRPTAYASAYGVRHPAAQEALRSAAIVQVDFFADSGEYELEELLPPDARDLISDMLVGDFADTIYLVGWKLGQSRRQLLGSFAEQVAAYVLLEHAEATLDRDDAPLTLAGVDQARGEIDDLRESILDEMFLHEYLPNVEAFALADLVPGGVESRRASLWAPWYPGKGEPPPRATGDDEPEWSLRDGPGVTPRQAVAASGEERSEETGEKLDSLAAELAGLPWRLEQSRRGPYLLAGGPGGAVQSFSPPPALFGAGPAAAPWAWNYGRYPSRDAALSDDVEPERQTSLGWEDFFGVFPEDSHPLAVDAIFYAIEMAAQWVGAVGGHALPGGAVEPFEQSARALEGIVALREQLEKCRAADLVHDPRLARRGIRHELFGKSEEMRFVAEARFAIDPGSSFDEVQGRFNQAIFDFSPLPISLGIEPHEDDDGSVVVRCAMGVGRVEEAFELAQEVISQVLWRVGLEPIDLEDGEEGEEVGFEILDLQDGEDPHED
jgi:hypothetical protein